MFPEYKLILSFSVLFWIRSLRGRELQIKIKFRLLVAHAYPALERLK